MLVACGDEKSRQSAATFDQLFDTNKTSHVLLIDDEHGTTNLLKGLPLQNLFLVLSHTNRLEGKNASKSSYDARVFFMSNEVVTGALHVSLEGESAFNDYYFKMKNYQPLREMMLHVRRAK